MGWTQLQPLGEAMKKRRTFDHEILLLQGGGALGAYQAGVYEGLAEADVTPTWMVGISIGAVNSAIIAGNPPERRIERLRTFWDRVSTFAAFEPPAWLESMRPMLGRMSIATVATFGIPGFFKPRGFMAHFAQSGSPEALSYYDTTPLKETLEELVDFDLINRKAMRLSLGAVNVRTGESVYFDNHKTRIGPEHVMASGALPPGFPSVLIDSQHYWDGEIVSNSPLTYVWDEKPLTTALIMQVNLFNAQGELPRNIDEAMERVKDIQFSSKQRLNNQRVRELGELRTALGRLLDKLPANLKADPDAQRLVPLCDHREWTIAHINNRRPSHAGQGKDAEFSRSTVNAGWAAGLEDMRISAANLEWMQPTELGPGIHLYFLPPVAHVAPTATEPATGGNQLAGTLITSGDVKVRNIDRGIELATKANELAGYKNPASLNTLIKGYLENGDKAAAQEALGKLLALKPDDANTLNQWAWYFAMAPDPQLRDPKRRSSWRTRPCVKRLRMETSSIRWASRSIAPASGNWLSKPCTSRWSYVRAATLMTGSSWLWHLRNSVITMKPDSGTTKVSSGQKPTIQRTKNCCECKTKHRKLWGWWSRNHRFNSTDLRWKYPGVSGLARFPVQHRTA